MGYCKEETRPLGPEPKDRRTQAQLYSLVELMYAKWKPEVALTECLEVLDLLLILKKCPF